MRSLPPRPLTRSSFSLREDGVGPAGAAQDVAAVGAVDDGGAASVAAGHRRQRGQSSRQHDGEYVVRFMGVPLLWWTALEVAAQQRPQAVALDVAGG